MPSVPYPFTRHMRLKHNLEQRPIAYRNRFTDCNYFRGCYLLKLKFFILKSASMGDQVEPYIIADTQSDTPGSTYQSAPNPMQPPRRESSGPTAPITNGLTSRPASAIPSEIPSSKTLPSDSLSGTPSHQASGLTREQQTSPNELSNAVRQLQAETLNLRQVITDMQRNQRSIPSQTLVDSQANEIRSLRRDMQALRDRVAILEKANKARSQSSQPSTSQNTSFVNERKRSFAQSNGISPAYRQSPVANPQSSMGLPQDQDVGINNVKADDSSTPGDDDDLDIGASVTASELASRQMVPSSVSDNNGDITGEMVVIGATNTATALEDLGPGEVNGSGVTVTHRPPPTTTFVKPSLPSKRKSGTFEGLGESQISEYIPSGISTETTATPDIRPASFVPLNRNHHFDPVRDRSFDSPPVAIEGWDNSQDMDYRPSGEVSTGSFRGTPDSARYRGRGRGRGSGGGSRGAREAVKFKNYSARLTEPAPWESEDWDGTTGTTALIRSPSSRGRTVRQRGSSSTNRTLTFDTPTGARKKSRLASDERPRDEAGRLLRANGMVDRRSERYHRKKMVPDLPKDAPLAASTTPATPATPANNQMAAPTTDSPKTHEDFMRRIYPNGRPTEQTVDDNMALR